MDILTHTVSGMAVGTVVAGFSERRRAGIVALSGVGGALPDVDVISLWSQFDSTFGKFLHLAYPGETIYSGKFWYSHHGFFHSIAAAFVIAAIIGAVGYLFRRRRSATFKEYIATLRPALAGFIAGFAIHLLQDMPTPASSWGGVRLLWPLKSYVGGTGAIWWWNNYDLFLVAAGVFAAGSILLFVKRSAAKYVTTAIFTVGCTLFLAQIHNRDRAYAYTEHTDMSRTFEAVSKEQQRKILGDRLYGAMEWFDERLPVNF